MEKYYVVVRIKKIIQKSTILFIISAIIVVVYLPFILTGGFGPGDDLSVIQELKSNNWNFNYSFSFRESNGRFRPLGDLSNSLVFFFFKDNPQPFIVTQLLIWFSSIGLIFCTLKRSLGYLSSLIILLLSIFPIFASHVIFSPAYIPLTLSIFFWALSLIIVNKYVVNKKLTYFLSAYLFLALGLLTLPLILPFLVVTALLPIQHEIDNKGFLPKTELYRLCLKYILPVFLVALSYLFIKVNVIKMLQGEGGLVYAASPLSFKSLFQSLYYFIAIFIEVPLMLVTVIPHLFKWRVFAASGLIIAFFVVLRKKILEKDQTSKENKHSNEKLFILIIIFSLISCASIFLISVYPASTFGQYNRMMLPGFILLSIFLGWGFSKLLHTRWVVVPISISILWVSSMIIQLDNFIKSWETRQYISTDIAKKLNNVDLGKDSILIANVPYFLKYNYNNESVTAWTWSFAAGIRYAGAKSVTVWPVCYRIVMDPSFYPNHNILNNLSTISDNANIWYYEYEEGNKKGILQKLKNKKALLAKFEEIKIERINYHPIILREKIRLAFKKLPLVLGIYERTLSNEINENI